MKTVTLHYSESLARQAVRTFFVRRFLRWDWVGAFAVATVALIYEIGTGSRSWLVGAWGAALALIAMMFSMVYVGQVQRALSKLRELRPATAWLEMGDDTFRLTSSAGVYEAKWDRIQELWRYRAFWLLVYASGQFNTIPCADLDEDSRQTLLARVTAQGGKVDPCDR